MKKVTIMIPTYNQPQYIEQCIDSVLKQSYPNLEIIISDDSTNNETEKIIKEKYLCDKRIKYFHNIPSLGRVKNYHKTLYERATGDYVLNLDGDDWLIDNNYISKAVNIINNYDVVCVMAKAKVYIEDENRFITYNNKCTKFIMRGSEYLYEYAKGNIRFRHLTTLYKRKEALKIGFYNKDIIFTDGESIFRLICNNDIAYLNEDVGVWRIHSNNTSKLFNNINNIEELLFVENSVYNFCKDKISGINLDEWVMNMHLKVLYPIFAKSIKEKDFYYVWSLLKSIFKYDKKLFINFQYYSLKNILKYLLKKIKVNYENISNY